MSTTFLHAGFRVLICAVLLTGSAFGQGHGHAYGKEKHEQGDDQNDRDDASRGKHYSRQDREHIRSWYREQEGNLPPGLAKKDELPPGLERQLRVNGTLPPGLRKKLIPCPEELAIRLAPPPPGFGNFVVGGHIALVNRSTYVVLDVIHFEK